MPIYPSQPICLGIVDGKDDSLPGAKEASNAPKKNLTAIIPDQLNVAACNVPHTAQPSTQNEPQMWGGTTFHISANGSKTM